MKNIHVVIITTLTELLENRFKLLGLRFGFEPLVGLIPGIGDLISLLLSLYIVWAATQLKVPQNILFQMVRNIVFDFLLGLIPVIGDVSDFIYKANSKNLVLLKRHGLLAVDGEYTPIKYPKIASA